jgi:hypothetical protein
VVSKGDAQREIPQLHGNVLVGLGYAVRRLGELGLTASGIRRLAAGKQSLPSFYMLMTASGSFASIWHVGGMSRLGGVISEMPAVRFCRLKASIWT